MMDNFNMYRGVIYKYTSPSGKIYIGQTRDESGRRRRWFQMTQSYAGVKIDNARAKYGPENFEYEILFSLETSDEYLLIDTLNEKEEYYISVYNSIQCGYNSAKGGKLEVIPEYTKKNISDSHKKSILLYDLDGNFIAEWGSSKEASESLNISSGNISLVLNGKRYQCKNFIFRFKESDDIPLTIPIIPTKLQSKVVLKLSLDGDLIKLFSSLQEAASDAGINRNWFKKYVEGKDNHIYKGFIWKYKYEH